MNPIVQACPRDVIVNWATVESTAVATVSFTTASDVEHVREWIVHGSWDGAVDVVCSMCSFLTRCAAAQTV